MFIVPSLLKLIITSVPFIFNTTPGFPDFFLVSTLYLYIANDNSLPSDNTYTAHGAPEPSQ